MCEAGEDMETSIDATAANITDEMDVALELRLFREEMRAARAQMKELTTHIASFSVALAATNARIDKLECRAEVVERELNVVVELRNTIDQLKLDLNDKDQESLSNDIEITGIPESKGENPIHLVTLVAVKLGVEIEAKEIVHASRAGPPRIVKDPAVSATPRPRPIAVRLARRTLRDNFLRGARVRREATIDVTVERDSPGSPAPAVPHRFYVNERLTRLNRHLFYKAREIGKLKGWKYVWTKEGRILARQEPGQVCHRIRSDSDIERVFRSATVSSPVTVESV